MIPGRPLRWMATPTAAADGQNPAYRPAHRPAFWEEEVRPQGGSRILCSRAAQSLRWEVSLKV